MKYTFRLHICKVKLHQDFSIINTLDMKRLPFVLGKMSVTSRAAQSDSPRVLPANFHIA